MNKRKKIISFAIIICMITTIFPLMTIETSAAAKTKTVKKSYYTLEARGAIKKLDIWGKDTFTLKYNSSTKKIVSCTPKQTSQCLGTRICDKGGIKCKKVSSKKWQYTSTWYVRFDVLPTSVRVVAAKVTPYLAAISDLGRFMKATYYYDVHGSGKIARTKVTYSFMVPSNLKTAAKKVAELLVDL